MNLTNRSLKFELSKLNINQSINQLQEFNIYFKILEKTQYLVNALYQKSILKKLPHDDSLFALSNLFSQNLRWFHLFDVFFVHQQIKPFFKHMHTYVCMYIIYVYIHITYEWIRFLGNIRIWMLYTALRRKKEDSFGLKGLIRRQLNSFIKIFIMQFLFIFRILTYYIYLRASSYFSKKKIRDFCNGIAICNNHQKLTFLTTPTHPTTPIINVASPPTLRHKPLLSFLYLSLTWVVN